MLVSGMIIGTLFTLFVVPSIYVLVARHAGGGAAWPCPPTRRKSTVPELAEAAFLIRRSHRIGNPRARRAARTASRMALLMGRVSPSTSCRGSMVVADVTFHLPSD